MECCICTDDAKGAEDYVQGKVTVSCDHPAHVCRSCLQDHIQHSFRGEIWDHIECPECGQRLDGDEVNIHGNRETVAE